MASHKCGIKQNLVIPVAGHEKLLGFIWKLIKESEWNFAKPEQRML